MSRGYIVIAQNNDTVDYLEQAYALALNLKLTQSTVNNLTVCVDATTKKLIKAKHKKVFDNIVDIPWQDDAKDEQWKINNKWKYYYMTPYDETVILDTDMIFPTDVSHWWDIMSQRDVWATTKVYSTEHQRNYAIQQQGDRWGDMVKQLCDVNDSVCNILEWIPNIDTNVHAAMYEYVPGETVDNIYCEVGKKYDTGHPDVIAGKLEPYWGTISCVNVSDYMHIKREVIKMYINMCTSCRGMDLSIWNYQQTENEPDWSSRWEQGDNRHVLNVDDWRLQNIIETDQGDWKYIKPDRLVMTDLTNATNRFVADMRNQTNISIDFKTIMERYENTLV